MKVDSRSKSSSDNESDSTSEEIKSAIIAFMSNKSGFVEFSVIESEVPGLEGYTQGAIHQSLINSGFSGVMI
jgi:hypothetical protein